MHLRSIGDVVDVVDIVTVGGTPALLAYSAGVGAVELLLAVSRQRVLDQMVDIGWIKKHYTFHSVDRPFRLS